MLIQYLAHTDLVPLFFSSIVYLADLGFEVTVFCAQSYLTEQFYR